MTSTTLNIEIRKNTISMRTNSKISSTTLGMILGIVTATGLVTALSMTETALALVPLQQAYGQTSGGLEIRVSCIQLVAEPSHNQLTCSGQVSDSSAWVAIRNGNAQVQEGCQVKSGTVLPKSVTTTTRQIGGPTSIFTTNPDGSFVYHSGVVPSIQCNGAAEPIIISVSYSGSFTATTTTATATASFTA